MPSKILHMRAFGASDCERARGGVLAQPCNAVTSLAFVLAGAFILDRGARSRHRRASRILFGATTVATGIGSGLYHGPQPAYAQRLHDLPIIAVLSQVALFEIDRVRRGHLPEPRAYAAALASVSLGAVAYKGGRTSSRLCNPDSVVQLHGVWHLCAAFSLAAYARAYLEAPSR